MSNLSFKDRFLTPPVAEAMMAPSTIVVSAVGASIAIATGLPLVVAPIVALAGWAGSVLRAVPRNRSADRIDPFTVPEPWRRFVVEALKAQVRYQQAIASAERGPIQDRLRQIGERLDDGVQETWRIARRGAQLVEARAAIDDRSARSELERIEGEDRPGLADDSPLARTMDALRSQLATADRLDGTIEDTRAQLQLLDARLDEAVARAAELSVRADDVDALRAVDTEVEGLVQEMESLRTALEETTTASRPGSSGR